MGRSVHVHISIEAAIANAKYLKGCLEVDGYTFQSVSEIRGWLKSQQDLGRKVLPLGCCDNFDYQTGCRGHVTGPQELAEEKNK